MSWKDVHKLIIYCTTQILALQKDKGLLKPCDGYVQFSDLKKNDEWYAGKNRGYTNVVMVQLTISLQRGFSGHGYPLDATRVNALGKDAYLASGKDGDRNKIVLSGANNVMRVMRIGA
jgi:hypothetical protein